MSDIIRRATLERGQTLTWNRRHSGGPVDVVVKATQPYRIGERTPTRDTNGTGVLVTIDDVEHVAPLVELRRPTAVPQ